jgi:AraC-like DNA-binding protein
VEMIKRSAFATRDPEEAREFLTQAFVGARWRRSVDPSRFRLANERIDAGSFQIDRMKMGSRVASTFRPDGVYFVTYLAAGTVRIDRAGEAEVLIGPGQLVLGGQAGVETTTETDDFHQHVITIPVDAVREARGFEPGGEEVPEFASVRPIDERHAYTWAATRAYVAAILADGAAASSELLVGSASRLLASLLVDTFPAAGPPVSSARRDRRDARRPESLRRALAFIEANPQRDIGIGAIAAAARVSPRAVEAAFRRHLGVTPIAYLRRVRLDHAHQELSEASGADGLTVTEVSYRWGFSSPSRFSEYYRRAFGHPPSETLDR